MTSNFKQQNNSEFNQNNQPNSDDSKKKKPFFTLHLSLNPDIQERAIAFEQNMMKFNSTMEKFLQSFNIGYEKTYKIAEQYQPHAEMLALSHKDGTKSLEKGVQYLGILSYGVGVIATVYAFNSFKGK